MGKERTWNAAFPDHLRRSRSKKPKWQKKMKAKTRDLEQNLEKLENRIFAQKRQERMRLARLEARLDMQDTAFQQVGEKEAKPVKKPKTPFIPRLEDPDEDIYIPSEDSSESDDEEERQRSRTERLQQKKQRRAERADPLGLDDEGEGPAIVAAAPLKSALKKSPSAANNASAAKTPAPKPVVAATKPKKPIPEIAPKKKAPKPTSEDVPKDSTATDAPKKQENALQSHAEANKSFGPFQPVLKKRKQEFDSIATTEAKQAPPPGKKMMSAYERRQLKKQKLK